MGGPYLTQAELLEAPTGIEWGSIPVEGSEDTPAQTAAIANILARATGWVDKDAEQKLSATLDTETWSIPSKRAWFDGTGKLCVYPYYSPVIAVSGMAFSYDRVTTTPLVWNVRIPQSSHKAKFELIQPPNWHWSYAGASYGSPWDTEGEISFNYANGYPNCFLLAGVTAGAVALSVDDPTGILPGTQLTIFDGLTEETITVLGIVGPAIVPTAPLLHAHTAGARVSALPSEVRQAMIWVATELATDSGINKLEMTSDGRATVVKASTSNFDRAHKILENVRRVP